MAKHRSLSNALLSPEKMAFIKGQDTISTDTPPVVQQPIQSDATVVPVVEFATVSSPIVTDAQPMKKSAFKRPQPNDDEPSHRNKVTPSNEDYLVAITTRLQARTAESLRRAYLEQKLNRREPATQQEIIELALQEWLRTHNFLE